MRPVYLEIEGLHSFKSKQEIDFNKLGETGLFGIFGPTGSGKSTILDAVTLALYGNVQRALRGTQGIINTNADNVRVCFAFDLLRKGQKRRYRVERVYKRKKDSDTSVEAKTARLFEIAGDQSIPLVDKPGEVTAKVEELLGLQLDDFTRTVVLPQNKFQEFLLLEKAKKRDMLEKIFFLEEYGRQLLDRVSKRMGTLRIRMASLEGAISSLGECSEKALVEAETRMKQAKEQRDRVEAELKRMEARFHEAKEVWSLSGELAHIIEREQQHRKYQEEINQKKKIYESAMKASGLGDGIIKYREGVKRLSETRNLFAATDESLEKTRIHLENARAQYEKCREAAEKEQPSLIEKRTKLGEALLLKNEIAELDIVLGRLREQYSEFKQKITAVDKEVELGRLELGTIEKERGELRSKLEDKKVDSGYRYVIQKGVRIQDELQGLMQENKKMSDKHKELYATVADLQKTGSLLEQEATVAEGLLDGLKLQAEDHQKQIPDDRSTVLKEIECLHASKATLGALDMVGRDIGVLETRLAGVCEQAACQNQKLSGIQSSVEELQATLVQLRERETQAKHQSDMDAARILAVTLKDGEPCPVCGASHHPSPAASVDTTEDSPSEDLLLEIREEMSAVEGRYRECESECIRLLEQVRILEERRVSVEEELAAKRQEYAALLKNLPESMKAMALQEIRSVLDNLGMQNQERLKDIEQWEKKTEDIRKSTMEASDLLAKHKAREAALKSELSVNCAALDELGLSLNELSGKLSEKQNEYQAFLKQSGIDDAHVELKNILDRDIACEKYQKLLEQLEGREKVLRSGLDVMGSQRQSFCSSFDEVRVEGEGLKRQRLEKQQKIIGIAGDKDIAEEIRTVETKLDELAVLEKQNSELVRQFEASFNELHSRRRTLENQMNIFSSAVEGDGARLMQALRENGFESIEEAEKCLITPEQKEVIDLEIKEYERVHRNLEAQREIVVKRLAGRTIDEDEWQKVHEAFLQMQQEKDRRIERLEEAKTGFTSLRKSFDVWIKLHAEFMENRKKLELLEQIQKLLKGNSFVEYILEERLRYIAREASETLGVLTKYRYSLELDAENGFVIRDNSNGGVHRPVSSLSGGETFLTSLSLALALSKQIQLKGQSPLEFFFLDEGFGTLDSELLDNVMDSLGRLSSRERVIGLISHVPELRNRMARRLIVDPPSVDGRGSRVRIEKA